VAASVRGRVDGGDDQVVAVEPDPDPGVDQLVGNRDGRAGSQIAEALDLMIAEARAEGERAAEEGPSDD
jgi:hypothetical protein